MNATATAPTAADVAEVVTGKRPSVVRRVRNAVAGVFAFLAVFLLAGPANASTPTDPTNGAGDSFITGLQDYFLTQVVGKALGLMAIVLSISVLVSWGRKAIKSR